MTQVKWVAGATFAVATLGSIASAQTALTMWYHGAGNEVEKRTHTSTSYQVRVRMDNGESRTFPQQGADGWRVGDRVRVVNGELTSRG